VDIYEISVLIGGVVLIAAILWYFFGVQESVVAKKADAGVQEVEIVVDGGYSPGTIELKSGIPARLVFNRQENSSCSEEVILGEFGIARKLPAFEKTVIEFTPNKAGKFTFTCGMGMLRGTLLVKA
jgi:plastocyanin domain-containing protein